MDRHAITFALVATGAAMLAFGLMEAAAEPRPLPSGLVVYRGRASDGDTVDGQIHRTPATMRYEDRLLPAYPGSDCAFAMRLVPMLRQEGLPPESAVLFAAHVARETGFGRRVHNYNFGNVKQSGAMPWHRLSDGEPYASYPSEREGLRANVALVRDKPSYRAAWQRLLAGELGWYSELGLAHYYLYRDPVTNAWRPHTAATVRIAQGDYERILDAVRRCLG